MENELDELREEIERLTTIISFLTDKLRLINTLSNSNTQLSGDVNTSAESTAGNSNMINFGVYSYLREKDGANINFYDTAAKKDGVNSTVPSIHREKDGANINFYDTAAKKDGVNSTVPSILLKKDGVNINFNGTAVKKDGAKQINIALVMSGLREEMRTGSGDSINNTAKILVQLQTTPRIAYKELRKLTGMSEGGMVKRIMAMKKRGLIVRAGFQHYTLTGKALEILDNAMR